MDKMKEFGIKSAWLLAAGAIFALSVTVLNSCSSDGDYDMYMGDELRTHAAATRSAAPEPGMSGSGDIVIYHYSFKYVGSQTENVPILPAEGLIAHVTFSWNNNDNAETTQINTGCTFTVPKKLFRKGPNEYFERPLYVIGESRYTQVIPEIGNAAGKSLLKTDLTVLYREIKYDSLGNEESRSATMTYFNLVTADVTDKIQVTMEIMKK